MNIITLTTDFGTKDYAVGALKGAIFSSINTPQIVDISHEIEPFNIQQTAYILKNAYRFFPKNTIHIIGVNNELTPNTTMLVLKYEQQFFICADNGFISLFCDEKIEKEVYKINNIKQLTNFPTAQISVKIAQIITNKIPLEQFGEKTENFTILTNPSLIFEQNSIIGEVIYIDHYGNVISNITKSIIEKYAQGRSFDIYFRSFSIKNIKLHHIFEKYNDFQTKGKTEEDGKEILIFNQLQYLELAIYKSNPKTHGSASTLFNLNFRDHIRIIFN